MARGWSGTTRAWVSGRLREVAAVPVVQPGQVHDPVFIIEAKPAIVAVGIDHLVLELPLEAGPGVGLRPQLRTALCRAHQGEVDPRLVELRPDLLVLDLVEAPDVATHVPSPVAPALVAGNVLDPLNPTTSAGT